MSATTIEIQHERPTPTLDPAVGATAVPDRAAFERLSRRDDVPGALGVREVKFLLAGVDTAAPRLYFINTARIAYHYDFAVRGLGIALTLGEFNTRTYFRDERQFLAGTLIAHDRFVAADDARGLFALEFWPTDPVKAPLVALAFAAVAGAMPFAAAQLAYHPAGETQEALFRTEAAELDRRGVRAIDTATLFRDLDYSPLNPGEGFGVLRVAEAGRPGGPRDVVIFRALPNDLARVGGVISETPQTPLSHVNLKAKQNDTPNAFIKGASAHPRVAPLLGTLVRYTVGPDDFTLAPATQAEADAWLERLRPPRPQVPPRDLRSRRFADLDQLGHADAASYGAKAANVAELRRFLPTGMVPDGYAVPFSAYHTFMRANGFYDAAARLLADPAVRADAALREERLADFRRTLKRAPVPPRLAGQLAALHARFPVGTGIRCRSSTNNEDVEGFNGAGLYDSYTQRPDEGALAETVKQVWASLWNFRAVEEREFHRIDHLRAAMGVLLHPNYDDEAANGVAVTRNIYDPAWPGFYINVQVGESLVTNPDPDATPDELLVSAIGPHGEYETQYIGRSSLAPGGATVLTPAQVAELADALARVQRHFARAYGKEADPAFAMDVEFKINVAGRLVLKQARPWVD
jgi:hypothetical protein